MRDTEESSLSTEPLLLAVFGPLHSQLKYELEILACFDALTSILSLIGQTAKEAMK